MHRLQRKLEYAAKPRPELVSKRQKLEKLKEDLSQVLSAATLNFVLSQIRVATAKNKGQRWTPQDKALALSLLHSSPKTYRLLQKIFRLPSVKTLSRVMQNICVYPGFNSNILHEREGGLNAGPAQTMCHCVG